ncbi:hypothetical protein GCM10011519_22450 [Marmoricola endophyticus]|uniref:Uncharacterized protein n=1 Tax=Marmoricola endophyticus TaxID=2040280 RepID=A0A917BJ64_9ACTN|nr:hypothetical protein GCM10011519_22450 [Marmoricola endophyticus]
MLAALLPLAVLVAACGQQSGDPVRDDDTAPDLARGTWVLRIDGHGGADGETTTASYLMVRPAEGSVRTVSTPAVQGGDTGMAERALLVDAGHRLALADTVPSAADQAAGRAQVTVLADGRRREVDLRKATGDPSLRADHVAFDADVPGQLRVVSGRSVWVVDLGGAGTPGRAVKEGELPITDSWIFGGFAPDTGDPFLSSIDSFETRPKGYGELDEQVLRRAGGRVLPSDGAAPASLAGQPADASCQQVTGFVESGGRAWEFCLSGTDLVVKVRAKGRAGWATVGPPAQDVVPPEHDLVLVLPPA